MRLSRRELVLAEMEKQIPPLRRRIRSGSGRNDRAFFAPESGMKKGCPPSLKLHYCPTQAKGGLEWATGQGSSSQAWGACGMSDMCARFARGADECVRAYVSGVERCSGQARVEFVAFLVVAHHAGWECERRG
jgi:hypothetical protein